jgi:predicted small metal-binding protein
MAKLIRCECGFVARGESDDQVVGVIRGHMASDHPALLVTVSQEDLLSWVQAESLRLAAFRQIAYGRSTGVSGVRPHSAHDPS